jgi:asparagine synthase (glutamine-hydrolysing)
MCCLRKTITECGKTEMCGLVAWARIGTDVAGVKPGVIEAMLRRVSHRGPDQEEILQDRHVALGFSRLSLVAPDAASQPLISADGRYTLVANGEVYNYRELQRTTPGGDACRTGSDCEILLYLYAAHGPDFLTHIHGMISTIIWDRVANKLILSRDSSGVKPLFFHVSADRVAVGSEIKALFADDATPRTVDWEGSLATTSLHGTPLLTLDRAQTWFTDVQMVQAGTTVEIDLTSGDITTHQYWHPRLVAPDTTSTPAEFIERYRDVLTRSVRENREADAEVGLLLSGGIDSVSVAALTEPGMATFTVLSGSTAANGDAEFAHHAALKLGHHNHQILVPDTHTPSLEEWLRFLCLMETPLATMEAYLKYLAYVGAKTVNPSLRGMMIGTGADEFAGGYAQELAQGGGWDAFTGALESLVRATARSAGLGAFHWTDRDDILDLVSSDAVTPASMTDAYAAFVDRKFLDVEQYNTWVEDRAASGSSVEGRVPFLDRDLVELAVSVPPQLRRELLWDKAMLREATRGVVPERLRTREKQPFFHGVHENHAFDVALRMLKTNDYEMVRTACAGDHPLPFTVDSAVQFIARVEKRPSHSAIEYLLRLVNLALLDQLAAGQALGGFEAGAALPTDVEIVTYDGLSAGQQSSLLSEPELDPDSAHYSLDDECEAVAPIGEAELIYIARNGEFEMVIDEDVAAWSQVLPVLGTPQTRKAVIDLSGLDVDLVHRLLDDGLTAGFVRAGRAWEDR